MECEPNLLICCAHYNFVCAHVCLPFRRKPPRNFLKSTTTIQYPANTTIPTKSSIFKSMFKRCIFCHVNVLNFWLTCLFTTRMHTRTAHCSHSLRKRESLRHGQDKFRRLPLGLQTAEGSTYNIIAPHRTYDYYQRARIEEGEQKARDDNLKQTTEKALAQRTIANEKLNSGRALARISHTR